MKRILIVTNVPNPYRLALFKELNRQLKAEGMDLLVVFGAEGYSRRLSKTHLEDAGFNFKILEGGVYTSAENTERTVFGYKGLGQILKEYHPYRTIVIGFSPATLRLFFRSIFKKAPYIIWAGSILKKGRNDSFLRKIQRSILIRGASAFIAYGSKAKEYFISFGVPPEKIAIAMNTSDPGFFIKETQQIRINEGSGYNDGKHHLLYIGYLVRRKRVDLLLELMKKLTQMRDDVILDIVGDGESKTQLEQKSAELNLENHVKFHGFLQKQDLPRFLAKSNVFLFQTDFDVWGLTLNEAMAAGLPVLSSINAGATYDLIKEGITGYAVDYRDTSHVISLLNKLLEHPEFCREMGENARQWLLEKASLEKSAAGFLEAIRISEQQ